MSNTLATYEARQKIASLQRFSDWRQMITDLYRKAKALSTSSNRYSPWTALPGEIHVSPPYKHTDHAWSLYQSEIDAYEAAVAQALTEISK